MRRRRSDLKSLVGVVLSFLLLAATVAPVVGNRPSEQPQSWAGRRTKTATPNRKSVTPGEERNTSYGRATEAYGKRPMSFEANEGQADSSVKFLAHGLGYQLQLTQKEAVLLLSRNESADKTISDEKLFHFGENTRSNGDVLRMDLLHARSDARITGEDVLSGKANYLVGDDPHNWHRNISTYKKVRYQNIYQGIDLIFYGSQHQLEYDFQLAPGADPRTIRLGLKGVIDTEIDGDTGELIMRLASGEVIRQHKPVLYQQVGGVQRSVEGWFALRGHNQIGFEVGDYDKSRTLIIDPVIVYATYFAGDAGGNTSGIAVDSMGSVYVTGSVGIATGFPVTPNAFQRTQNNTNGNGEVFITKFTPDGTDLVYSTLLGGSSTDWSTGIALDAAGNAYVVGSTVSSDFPMRNPFQSTLRGFPNAFVSKLNSTGSDLLYSTFFGGTSDSDFGTDIAVDASGSAYITGVTASPNFPVTPGALRTSLHLENVAGDQDGFVAKFNANASGAASLIYSTFCDVDSPFSNSIDIDASGNAYVTGEAKVQKINAAGSGLLYDFTLPDSGGGTFPGLHSTGIAVDSGGHAYITGLTGSPGLQVVNGFQTAHTGDLFDGFFVKLNPAGTAVLYSTYLGGSNLDGASDVAVDALGHAFVIGESASPDFPIRDAFQKFKIGGSFLHDTDIFIAEIDTNTTGTNSLVFSTYYGTSNFDEAAVGVVLDAQGNIYLTGYPFTGVLSGIIHTGLPTKSFSDIIPPQHHFESFIVKIANASSSFVQFGTEQVSASEGAGSIEVSVARSGDTSTAAKVDFATLNGRAEAWSDFTSAYGTLRFAPGESLKTFRVLITDDTRAEGDETLYVILRGSTPGLAIAFPSVAQLTITDNDAVTLPLNPIDNRQFFVRQHYLDFLSREPDPPGFNFWVGQISAACDGQRFDDQCIEQRVNVSGAFFMSIEFLEEGYLVYRLHKASFGSLPHFTAFLRDTQEVGRNVIVNQPGWELKLAQNQQQLLADWVQRLEFKAKYDGLTNAQYVDALNANTGNSLTTSDRDNLVGILNAGTATRAEVLRAIADNQEFRQRELSPAFVLMQYFGYLRRDPDVSGYQFWLNKLNQFGGDFRRAEMVKSFIISGEYRSRFNQE